MSGTALDHPLVRDYLRDLDAALARLPAGRAAELREQITAHLDDALPPDAPDDQVSDVLRRLGPPADLAAEAGPPLPPPPVIQLARAIRRSSMGRLGWRRWTVIGVTLAALFSTVGYAVAILTATPLQMGDTLTWWYRPDYSKGVFTYADGATQYTAPIRSGKMQGFAITVYNPTGWTQTVLGVTAGWISPGGPGAEVSVASADGHNEGELRYLHYSPTGSVPPYQIAALRILWKSTTCLPAGGSQGTDELSLRVRVGWVTRTEVISLDQEWALSGPSTGIYSDSGDVCT